MAQVFAYDEGRVLKLDRPEWNGIAALEIEILTRMAEAGLPVPRADAVVTVEDRSGIVMERIDGPSLLEVLFAAADHEVPALAERFVELQATLVETQMEGLADLLPRLANEIGVGGLAAAAQADLTAQLSQLDDGSRGICHFDFHPGNLLVAPAGWVVIDWLSVATGPPLADVARTLLLCGRFSGRLAGFIRAVRARGMARHGIDDAQLAGWLRVLAAARLAEGFEGADAAWLREVASGERRLEE